jgi:hypothetical protein
MNFKKIITIINLKFNNKIDNKIYLERTKKNLIYMSNTSQTMFLSKPKFIINYKIIMKLLFKFIEAFGN